MFKSVNLGTISTTVLQNAAPLPTEKNVNLCVNVLMFTVILLLDVLNMIMLPLATKHKVFYFKRDCLFIQLQFWTLYIQKPVYQCFNYPRQEWCQYCN